MSKFAFTLLAILFVACADESPFMPKEEAAKQIKEINDSRDPFHGIGNVVAIINSDIYYFDLLTETPRRLTNSPTEAKTQVKLSSDRTKIAYLNKNGNPVILNAADGKVLETLTQFSYITQMDWMKNNETLYMLIGRKVMLHGPSVTIKQPETVSLDEVSSFSMNGIGDSGHFIRRYGEYQHALTYRSNGQDVVYKLFDGDRYDYIDFSDNQGNFILGRRDYYDESSFEHIICVKSNNSYASYDWDDERMMSPEFNMEREVLIYANMSGSKYQVNAVYLGTDAYDYEGVYDILKITLTDYPSTTPIYVDWVP